MGNAKRRGTYDERVTQALAAGRVKRVVISHASEVRPEMQSAIRRLIIRHTFPVTLTEKQRRRKSKRLHAARRKALGVLA